MSNNREQYFANSEKHNINTGHSYNLHLPCAHLNIYQKVKDNVGRTQLVYYQGVNEITCFDLLRGHHQVYNDGSKRLIIM